MMVKSRSFRLRTKSNRFGLSLLEVIIATVVLAVSSLMLVRIIGNADRHASKADRRITAQMICQNKLDEVLSGLSSLESSDAQPDLYYPDWQCSVQVSEWATEQGVALDRLVLVEVEAFYRPELNLQQGDSSRTGNSEFDRPDYSLKRLVRRPVEKTLVNRESELDLQETRSSGGVK